MIMVGMTMAGMTMHEDDNDEDEYGDGWGDNDD